MRLWIIITKKNIIIKPILSPPTWSNVTHVMSKTLESWPQLSAYSKPIHRHNSTSHHTLHASLPQSHHITIHRFTFITHIQGQDSLMSCLIWEHWQALSLPWVPLDYLNTIKRNRNKSLTHSLASPKGTFMFAVIETCALVIMAFSSLMNMVQESCCWCVDEVGSHFSSIDKCYCARTPFQQFSRNVVSKSQNEMPNIIKLPSLPRQRLHSVNMNRLVRIGYVWFCVVIRFRNNDLTTPSSISNPHRTDSQHREIETCDSRKRKKESGNPQEIMGHKPKHVYLLDFTSKQINIHVAVALTVGGIRACLPPLE